ncbi:ABC transporter, ATP-binding protein [Labilithrix luteola]|uniref:ABC transporter, ATP-binding protein n=1 Tax=Labilithrix luteola TaxID=1391654 RepID=A0A0K1QAZ6_9BACT|nr:ATP-binding cassette domain-containing protein [Labilithrix luteola]AKV02961.1 ABC transporter, ATP-binding protein [Labilithrix luteola]
MIVLDKVTKRFGPKILFENVSMQFDPAKRYGLTGANGAGKSTLLKMLEGNEDTDTGSITIPGNLRLGVLKQNHFEYDQERILDTVIMGNKTLWDAMQEKERLYAAEMTDAVGIRLGELEGTIGEENGYMAESEAAELLVGLGIPTDKHESKMNSLAGGYKLRVLIAQVLFGKPDVLLLDEPTNHLDLESIRWLEHFLTQEFRGTLVVVSHDRHFLNEVVTHIADVDYGTVTVYTGNYADFVDAKYENNQRAAAQAATAKKKVAELQEFVQRFGSHASKSKQAQSRVKQIDKLKEEIESRGPKRSSLVRPFIRFEFDKPSGRDVVRLEGISKTFHDDKGKEIVVYDNVSFNVNRGDKIAVTGPNGIGKSTLLKLIVGGFAGLDEDTKHDGLQSETGEIRWGHETSVGYFAQDTHEALNRTAAGMNAFQWLYQWDKLRPQEEVRGTLGKLLFSGEAGLKQAATMSGGECARLLLAKLVLLKHNVLILDEPTNHLDIESIEGLLDGLKGFNGTIIFVSHDRHVVSELATRIVELRPKGNGKGAEIVDFGGTYDEFLEREGRDK